MEELELERESLISQWKAELEAERETLEPPSLSHILHKAFAGTLPQNNHFLSGDSLEIQYCSLVVGGILFAVAAMS